MQDVGWCFCTHASAIGVHSLSKGAHLSLAKTPNMPAEQLVKLHSTRVTEAASCCTGTAGHRRQGFNYSSSSSLLALSLGLGAQGSDGQKRNRQRGVISMLVTVPSQPACVPPAIDRHQDQFKTHCKGSHIKMLQNSVTQVTSTKGSNLQAERVVDDTVP